MYWGERGGKRWIVDDNTRLEPGRRGLRENFYMLLFCVVF